jgi:2-keto-4-pentenoate hydratase
MLFKAERDRIPISPLTEMDDALTLNDAYYIQLNNVRRAVEMGNIISGKKIGLTSAGIQKQMGVHEPDYGHLFKAMDCSDGILEMSQLIAPRIEAEIAFILSSDIIGGHVTAQDVLDATDYVVGSIEVVDTRVADWKIKLIDTVADNASSGRYILGEKQLRPRSIDLKSVTMSMYKNDELISEGSGSAVIGGPAGAVAWLANRLSDYGVPLLKGEVILSGAFAAAPAVKKGEVWRVEFSSFGVIEARFV